MKTDKSINPKVLILGAGFTTPNMGVWALATGAIASILSVYPTAKISFLDYHKQPITYDISHSGTKVTIKLKNIRFSYKIWLPNNIFLLLIAAIFLRLIPYSKNKNKLYSKFPYLTDIYDADFVCSVAGGDSFSDLYGLRRLIYVALPQLLILLIGSRLVLLPQTIGPFTSSIGRAIARIILNNSSCVFSRDREGFGYVRQITDSNSVNLFFGYDLGFVLEPEIRDTRKPAFLSQIDQAIPLIGLNISGLLYQGGYTQDNMFNLKCDYIKLIHDITNHFIHKYSADILLVPHVFGGINDIESDLNACRTVCRQSENHIKNRLHFNETRYNHQEIKALIGQCDFFLGSRMHACIAALSQCIPAVGLAYSRKFRGVFDTVGMKDFVLDLRKHDNASILDCIDKMYRNKSQAELFLEKKIPVVRQCIFESLVNIDNRFPSFK